MADIARTADAPARKRKRRAEDTRERERLARDIERTSESIREKRLALKTGMIEEEIALERRFKPIVEPLKRIAEDARPIEREVARDIVKKRKREDTDDDGDSHRSGYRRAKPEPQPPQSPPPPPPPLPQPPPQPSPSTSFARDEGVGETSESSLEASLRQALQTLEDRKRLHGQLGPLGRRYMGLLLGDDREKAVDHVYGVYFDKDGAMLGSKKFDVDKDDNVIVDNVRYAGTPGLFELIFKNHPRVDMFNDDDMQKYESILLATSAHKHGYKDDARVRSNRGHKYTNIIRPLVGPKKGEGVIPFAMRLTDNRIDYVHWDDPNELVDRLRLLDASRRAGNNAHDNEILSIVEELQEAGIIIV